MNGTHGRFKDVKMGTCRRMDLTSQQPLYIHCDGEIYAGFGTDVRKLSIRILPKSLNYMKV
jgi:diacylglycerol kinase (ATP)